MQLRSEFFVVIALKVFIPDIVRWYAFQFVPERSVVLL